MAQGDVSKYRVIGEDKSPTADPLSKYRVIEEPESKASSTSQYREITQPEEEEEKSILGKIWDWTTHSYLPDYENIDVDLTGKKRSEPDTYLGGFAKSIEKTIYDDIVKPAVSPLGLASEAVMASGALKPIGRMISKIPGVKQASEFLGRDALHPFTPVAENASSELPTTVASTPKPKVRANSDGTFSPIENPLIKYDQTGSVIPGPIEKLEEALKTSKKLTPEQAEIYRTEKGRRVAEAESVNEPGQGGFFKELGKLKGQYDKVVTEPLELPQHEVDALFDFVRQSPRLEYFQKVSARSGLNKLLSGQVPQEGEIALLNKALGRKLVPLQVKKNFLVQGSNLAKAAQATWDLSLTARQGKGLIFSPDWWSSWGSLGKAFGSEEAYNGVMSSILERPNFKPEVVNNVMQEPFFRKAGLHLTDLTDLTSREENLTSQWLEDKIPGVRRSNRANTAFINQLRADHFDRLIGQAEDAGLKPKENINLARQIAGFVNSATGRGSLGKAEKYAAELNSVIFSPRFVTSRLQMMNQIINPMTYSKIDPFVKKQYWKSMLGLAGLWAAEASLAKQAGGSVETDPRSSDFGKGKFGETRLDFPAGFQQYLVLASRLASQSYKTTTGKEGIYGHGYGSPTVFDAVSDFTQNKLAPIPSAAVRAARANDYRPFDVGDQAARLVTPMIAQDISDVLQDNPEMLLPLVPLVTLGYGAQTFEQPGKDRKLFGPKQPETIKLPLREKQQKQRRR